MVFSTHSTDDRVSREHHEKTPTSCKLELELSMSTNPPQRLGKYELQTRLGQGGMAEVWKAFDPQLKRYVAIKFMHT